jgi:hypothetical protein
MINPINIEAYGQLTTDQKIERMDNFLIEPRREKNPYYDPTYDLSPFVKPLKETKVYLDHPNKDKLSWMFFDLILQIEYVNSYFGMQNSVLDSARFKDRGWQSPANHTTYNSLTQATIVGSRIEFERLMRFIYFAFRNEEVSSDSTFSTFKNWLFDLDPLDDLVYLIPFLKICREHDQSYRTAEIHNGSKLKARTLALVEYESDEQNRMLDLHNCVGNLWRSMLPLLNRDRPNSAAGSGSFDLTWLSSYNQRDIEALKKIIDSWRASIH